MIVFQIVDALLLTALSTECFRILQSCSYKPQRGYLKIYLSSYALFLLIVQIVALLCYFLLPKWIVTVIFAVAVLFVLSKKYKCPIKYTKRILRMLIAQLVVMFCLCHFDCGVFLVIVLPFVTLVSWLICLPIDCIIANYYLKLATKKLSQSDIEVIAITGSYGKTCTKDMLFALLDGVVAPSGSCNTPLGIASFINKTDFSGYKYLILEFGARNVGDIDSLCKLFLPKYGIVTGICPQHLSTFKTLNNIIKTKGELVQNLPKAGFCVLNGADQNLRSLIDFGTCTKVITDKKFIYNFQTTLNGATFDVAYNDVIHSIHLPQVARYVVDTFLICFYTCILLGQSSDVTIANCRKIVQTPHRMQTSFNGSFWIVDDAYNANIKGVENCCNTLSQFDNFKIVLTQGIVEGGRQKKQLNEQCGKLLGKTFDVIIAIGKYAKEISSGASGDCKVICAKTLAQGVAMLQNYVRSNCIVLFQNDLPDVAIL